MDPDISFKEMVTPKYFAAGTLSSSTLCRMYLVLRVFAFFVI